MNDIKLIQLNNYVRPAIVENKSKDWVLNGRNNEFYQYVIDRKNGSPTNTSVLDSYDVLTYGKGLGFKNVRNTEDWIRLKTVLKPAEIRNIIIDFNLFGEAAIQIIKTKGKKLYEIAHIPKQKVVPQIENEDGIIEGYFVSNNWAKLSTNPPEYFPAFGTSKENIEIYHIKPYSAGKEYFPDPPYLASLPYCEMEEEIANLNINSIKNGLSAGYVINVPNGNSLTPDEKDEFEKQIKQKLTGSPNASRFILSFNGVDAEITITNFPVNDNIHKQWEFLTKEARQQILTGHRVTSPSLVGVISSSGFSNTAEEMDMAEAQLMKRVIAPKQNFILDVFEEILEYYDINLDLFFIPLTEEKQVLPEAKTELNKHVCLSDNIDLDVLLSKYALDPPEGFELSTSDEYDARLSANQTSEQDSKRWKIRYAYTKGTSKTPEGESRKFCNKMVGLSKNGKVFRKEDIDLMSEQGVNGQFAHEGGKYNIFLYGGGVNCYHRWERRIFKKKLNDDGTIKKGGALASTNEVNVNEAKRQGAKIPKNDKDVAIAEIDKPNNGSLR